MRRRAVLVGLLAFPLVSRVAAAITVDSEHGAKTQVRMRLSAGGGWIRTSGTADDARLLADLYAHNASRQSRKKGVRIRQLLVFAALGREWWARRRSVLSVSDPRERAARGRPCRSVSSSPIR